jgi:hypothetical protein
MLRETPAKAFCSPYPLEARISIACRVRSGERRGTGTAGNGALKGQQALKKREGMKHGWKKG